MTEWPLPSQSALQRFCDFLSHRLETDNLEVLVRIVCEFEQKPHCLPTADNMLALGFPLVSIFPVDNANVSQRLQAAKILRPAHHDNRDCSDCDNNNELDTLYETLKPKMVLCNWDWLRQIYCEFCTGSELALRVFVALKRQTISMIPVSPTTATVFAVAAPKRSSPRKEPIQRELRIRTKARPSSHRASTATPDLRRLLATITTKYRAIEIRQPWVTLFDVTSITFPFDATAYPAIAHALGKFWIRFARTVWERNFWCRLPQHEMALEFEDRRNRQRDAAESFERTVIVPLFNALGAAFFVDLDAQPERHFWWWYRGPLVDLVTKASALGVDACLQYMDTQADARFPVVPDQGEFRAYHHRQGHRVSMWSSMTNSKNIAQAIAILKRQREGMVEQ